MRVNLPKDSESTDAVKHWLNRFKKKYGDDWKLIIWKLLSTNPELSLHLHPLVKQHLARKRI